MEKVIEKYNKYIENYQEVWANRFTWRDSKGDKKPTTNIVEFFKETKPFDEIKHVDSLDGMFKQTNELAVKYRNWVNDKSKATGFVYSKKDLNNMYNFFIGAIGEFFVVCLLTEIGCINKYDVEAGTVRRYDFSKVAPLLPEDTDLGVDLTCMANDKPSVIQVKWWNPYNKERKLEMDVFHKLVSVGHVCGYCKPDEKDNRFLFWTGFERKTTKLLRRFNYHHWCVDLGDISIGNVIKERVETHFWDVFYEKLWEFSKTESE